MSYTIPPKFFVKPLLMTFLFRSTWKLLAEQGHCDALEGAEYNRVVREYHDAGYPDDMEEFIKRRANIQADGAKEVQRS